MVVPSIICQCLLFVETSINLTYYRDCVFGFTVFMLFFGMLWVNVEFAFLVELYDVNASVFTAVPTAYQYLTNNIVVPAKETQRSKTDYRKEAKHVNTWLMLLLLATFVWLLVSLVTDWKSVFYRKHIIYKKRMKDDLVRSNISTDKTLNSSVSLLNSS